MGRFPEPGDEELLAGSRAATSRCSSRWISWPRSHSTSPIRGAHLIRYYGWYSNKTRGQRAHGNRRRVPERGFPPARPRHGRPAKGGRRSSSRCTNRIRICCPRCGAEIKIIAFIERHQTEVIEKILRHCGLWEESPARAPPSAKISVDGLRLRARGTGGAVASRVRRGIRSTVNCTLGGRRDRRFQPLWPPDRPSWRLRPSSVAGGRPPTSPEGRPSTWQGTILPRFALNGHTQPGTLQPRRKSKLLLVTPEGRTLTTHPVEP